MSKKLREKKIMHKSFATSATLILALVCVALLGGCSKNAGNPVNSQPASIIGPWDLTGITSQYGGQTYTVPSEEIAGDPLTYTFNDDHTAMQYYQGEEIPFTWSVDGSVLATNSGYEINTYTFEVTTTTLKLGFQVEVYYITHIFTRR
jgi:hypothetical protein